METTITKPLYALLLLLTVCLGLRAQEIEEFTFLHIGQADGMHSQRIYSVVQTSDGALWWSSKHGVERYNGVNIKHYMLGDPDIFSEHAGKRIELCDHFGKDVKSPDASSLLAYDNKGRIYSYDAVRDRFVLLADVGQLLKEQIDLNDILSTAQGFWLATNKGIWFLHDETLIPVVRKVNANYIIPTNRSLLLCTREGVLEYKESQSQVPRADMKMKTIVPYDVESGYYDVIYNKVWLGGYSSGARVLSYESAGADGTYAEDNVINTQNPVRAFCPYDMNTMLVGIDGQGVYKIKRRPTSQDSGTLLFNANEGVNGVLHGNGIYTVVVDIWGNIVMGSYSGGIDIARPAGTMVAIYQHVSNNPQTILNDRVNAVGQTPSGHLMMGTENGISIYNRKTQTMTHACRGAVVLSLCVTPRGTMLASTYGQGVLEFTEDGASKPLYNVANGILKDDHVFKVCYDREGHLWMGGLDGDLVQLTADGPHYYPVHYVKDMLQLSDDRMAIATTYGIYLIHPKTGKTVKLNYTPAGEKDVNEFVHTLFLDNEKDLWIGTDGGGIYIYDLQSKHVHHLTTQNGLTSNFVNSIGKDVMGRIIIATERGLAFADPKDPSHIVGVNYCYGVDREYSSRAIINMSDGNIALGSTTGALVVNPQHIQAINYTAKLNLLGISCEGDDCDTFKEQIHKQLAKKKLHLSYDQRTFDLLFEAINLRNQSDIVYQYKVDQGQWSTHSAQQHIRFTSMEAGEHQLVLRCVSRTCGAVLDEVTLTISIGQPWWNSWWMWCVYIVLLGLIIYGAWRIHQLHEKYVRLVLANPGLSGYVVQHVEPVAVDASPEEQQEPDDSGAFISQATQLVIDNLSDADFTIDRLCREMAMSRTLFYVKLKSYTGKSPQDFIRIIRLERAAALLRSGKQVTEVAALTGFDNPKYFSTVFKKYFGVSPSKY